MLRMCGMFFISVSLAACEVPPNTVPFSHDFKECTPNIRNYVKDAFLDPQVNGVLSKFEEDRRPRGTWLIYLMVHVKSGYEPTRQTFDGTPQVAGVTTNDPSPSVLCAQIEEHDVNIVTDCIPADLELANGSFQLNFDMVGHGYYDLHVHRPAAAVYQDKIKEIEDRLSYPVATPIDGARSYDGADICCLWYAVEGHSPQFIACVNPSAPFLVGTERGTGFDDKMQAISELYVLCWNWFHP